MRKILFLAIVMLLTVSFVSAQDVFKKGDLVFNAGVGLTNSVYSGSGYGSSIPPISLSGEFGVAENLINGENGSIGVGGYLGYTGAKQNITADYGCKYSSIIVGARGAFHYEFARKLDTYAGTMLGYNIASAKVFGSGSGTMAGAASGFSFSLFLGARYWLTQNLGLYTELGYGISNINVGLTFRL